MASELHVDTIKHSGGTSALTIDSTGRVLTPARPSFKAKPSSSTSIAATNVIIFDDVTSATHGCHNIGGHYNTSTGIFTAPLAGVYVFSCCLYNNGSTDASIELFLGSQQCGVVRLYADGTSYDSMNFTQNILCASSDQVKFSVTDGTAYYNTNVSSISGYLLG